MKLFSRPQSWFARLACLGLFCVLSARAAEPPDEWQRQHDQLVARLRNLQTKAGTFGEAYQPIYEAALPWYERWGGINREAVDAWMMSPEQYAGKTNP